MVDHISYALTDWQGGYKDGQSCCNNGGEKIARKLSKIHPINRYEEGKKQAAIDWLPNKRNLTIGETTRSFMSGEDMLREESASILQNWIEEGK